MKFNVQRVLTPAYLTSVALVVLGVLFGLAWSTVAAWLFVLLGLALNAMAVSVTEIRDAPAARRRPSLPGRRARAEEPGRDAVEPGRDAEEPEGAPRAEPRPAVREKAPQRSRVVEPEAETAATPVVPAAGSSALKSRR